MLVFPIVCVYALFSVYVMQEHYLQQTSLKEMEHLKPSFGVFVTLLRLSVREEAVHGCLGNWSKDYSPMTLAQMYTLSQQLVQEVRTKDSRRFNFATDVNQDSSAVLKISFMHLPLQPVNNNGLLPSGEPFNNNVYGLIVDSNGQRATYLPKVFKTETWDFIKNSLIEKAGLLLDEEVTFWAYATTEVTIPVYDTLFSKDSLNGLLFDVATFYNKYYVDFVPFQFNSKTLEATVQMDEAVRNCACIADVIHLSQLFSMHPNLPVKQNLDYYYELWLLNEARMRQASIFLLKAYQALGNSKKVKFIQEHLESALLGLEPEFALGEAVSTLASIQSPQSPALFQACELMRERLHKLPLSTRSVFELNWQAQSAVSMYLNLTDASWKPWFEAFATELRDKLLVIVSRVQPTELETNYLAVVYECLTFLEMLEPLLGRTQPLEPLKIRELKDTRLLFFTTLLEFRRGKFGLYYFKDSSVARLDLTGHII